MSQAASAVRLAAGAPDSAAVMAQSRTENFPVASRLLPRDARRHLLAIYGFARLIDDAGDEASGDRLALLDELEGDLRLIWAGESPRQPLLARLAPTVVECELPITPFARLIDANRRDQVVHRYATYDELVGYCELSANPVGELVLRVFGAATPERIEFSDAVCTGLQLVEHWQDVAEDYGRGRVYLPAEDLQRFGVAERELGGRVAGAKFRALLAFEVDRARRLLDVGAPLIRTLRGRRAFALAGFVGGGRAALDAIERAGYDVLGASPRPRKATQLATILRTVLARR